MVDRNNVFVGPSEVASYNALKRETKSRSGIYYFSKCLSSIANVLDKSRIFGFLARRIFHVASRIAMLELSKVYDIELGYYLLIEAILDEHAHGTSFSIDEENEAVLKQAMEQHLAASKTSIDEFTQSK